MQIGSKKWKALVIDGAREMGIEIDTKQMDQLTVHAAELIKWNKKINLTAITDPLEVAVKHFLDSMAPSKIIRPKVSEKQVSILDIGSGGGFPGIVLKILIPSLSLTLIDASRKKVSFLKHIIRTLKLDNAQAFHVRVEDLAKDPDFQNAFDFVVCRAFTSLDAFVLAAIPFLAKDGVIIAMKGKAAEKEMNALRALKNREISMEQLDMDCKKYRLPYLGAERAIFTLKVR